MRWIWILGLVLLLSINYSFGQDVNKDYLKRNQELTLLSLLDSITFDYLGYEYSDSLDIEQSVKISHSDPETKIIVRDYVDPNPEPLIIISGHILEDKNLFSEVLLRDVTAITIMDKEKARIHLGQRAKNGVILVTLKKRKAKEIFNP